MFIDIDIYILSYIFLISKQPKLKKEIKDDIQRKKRKTRSAKQLKPNQATKKANQGRKDHRTPPSKECRNIGNVSKILADRN